jgi:hypothetical protein
MVLKLKKAQRTGQRTYPELPVLWQLFEETCWFFEIFQKPKTNSYFIPQKKKSFKNLEPEKVTMGRGFRVTKEPPKIEPNKKWVTTIGLWIAYFRVMKHILVVLEARHTNRYYHSTFSGSASRCRIIILF